LLEKLTAVLDESHVPFVVFDKVEPNPSVETVEAATKLFHDEGCVAAIGLGGGSPMDVAKSVGVMATNPSSIRDYEGVDKIAISPLPVAAIPTTAGTGSEVTPFIVITDTARRYKMTIVSRFAVPALAIIEPNLLTTMPPKIAAATGMDALTHGIESYVSLMAQPFSDALDLHGIHLIAQNLRKGVANRGNLEAMGNLAIASTMVAVAFSHTRLGNGHAIAHPLGGFYNIPHGIANAVLLPHIMDYNTLACPEKMTRLAQAMGVDVFGMSPVEGAASAVEAVRRLMEDIGISEGLHDLGVRDEEIPAMAADAMKSGNVLANPRQTTIDDIIMLYRTAL
jgi:alcohol dehydrogenase class IV